MPYKPVKRDNEWCVFKLDANKQPTGDSLGCHDTLRAAYQQMRALYAAENKQEDGRRNDPDFYAIVPDRDQPPTWKLPLFNFTDVSNAIQALSPAGFRGRRVVIPRGISRESVLNKIARRIPGVQASGDAKDKLRERLGAIKAFASVSVIKGYDGARYMFMVTSNSYEDRDREFITTKALAHYVDTSWKGDDFVGMNVLYFEHSGIPIGDVVWCGMEGPFLLELVKERSGVYANKRWNQIERTPGEWGASHGFNFRRSQQVNGTYYKIYKFETTVLKRGKAANLLTFAGVINEHVG